MAFNKAINYFDYVVLPGPKALNSPNGMNFDVGFNAYFSAGAGVGGYDVSGSTGDIDVVVRQLGYIDLDIEATGAAGTVDVRFRADAGGRVYIDADRFKDVHLSVQGSEASGSAFLSAHHGDIGNIAVDLSAASGSADVDAAAYNGSIGNILVNVRAAASDADVSAYASGGNIGDVTVVNTAGSGSGYIYLSAYAEINGQGQAVGGNIGDITLDNAGGSGDFEVYAYAYGAVGGAGNYKGGGNIGDITVINRPDSYSGELDVNAYAYSGGSIGNIKVITNPGNGGYSASGDVSAQVYGVSGHVASIGDIDVRVRGDYGNNNSGRADVDAYGGGNIGNITMAVDAVKAGSGDLDLYANAYASSTGGGRIGDIDISNNSWEGDNYISLHADRRIGQIDIAQTGGGSANVYLYLSGSADVGDIGITFGSRHAGWGGSLVLNLEDGASGGTVGDITIAGGSRDSGYGVSGGTAVSVGVVDLSGFNGSGNIDLSGVDTGTFIHGARRGSYIDGTEDRDKIFLGAGEDVVEVQGNDHADVVVDFQVTGTRDDAIQSVGGQFEGLLIGNPVASTSVDNGDVFVFADLTGGDDVTTAGGLLAALNGGEYGNLDAAAGAQATFVTAASASSHKFFVFEAFDSGDGGDFEGVQRVAVLRTDGTLADLAQDNFLFV